jgi:GT2 family glycosyltransferase
MDDRSDQDIPIVIQQASDDSPLLEDMSEQAAGNFDKDVYLRAFPDVAQAISDGICTSPLQHYIDHGRQENRLSHHSYLRILIGRQLEGHIDFYGHNSVAGGWIFCGWASEGWDKTSAVAIVAQFQKGGIAGESISTFHRRSKRTEQGTGFVLFVQGENDPQGPLTSVDVRRDDSVLIISAKPGITKMGDQEILFATRSLLTEQQGTEESREILALLSMSGYGRLRQPLNVLNGSVDSYGYHDASGGWFFCGWTTRFWDEHDGPDEAIAHFMDGDVISRETIAGFYPRDDLGGRGIGLVMFILGSERPLGSLVSIELRAGGIPSFIKVPTSIQRFRNLEIPARLRPIIDGIVAPGPNFVLLSLLSRKPYAGVDTLAQLSSPIFLEFDEVIPCPPGGLALMGWLLAKPGTVRSIRLRSSSLNEPFDLENCIKIERPDVIATVGVERGFDDTRCGFIAYLPGAVTSKAEMYVEVETADREVGFRKLPPSKLEGIPAIKRLLGAFEVRYAAVPRAFNTIIGPAVELLNERRLANRPCVDAIEFGQVNMDPRFSIVVPLYGRLDFLEPQMAFCSIHPSTYSYEFIFVLDDPPKRREAERLFASIYSRFQVPFRVLMMEHNVGFAPANNAGLRAANGTYVCFMNSDVFPDQADSLERLARRLETNPTLGAVGPLLLYGDGSVQHEGMVFRYLPEFGDWPFGDHLRKGKRKDAVSGLRKHISITGACMLMRRDLAQELGGFSESYIIGDFEDSDLCLQLHERGLDSAVDLDVELCHLERKSQGSSAHAWRMNLTLYNAWVHQRRWADTIAEHPLRQNCIPADLGGLPGPELPPAEVSA